MTLTRFDQIARQWWPAAISFVLFLPMLALASDVFWLTGMTVAVLAGLACLIAQPTVAFWLLIGGAALSVFAPERAIGIFLIALVATAVLLARAPNPRRLLLPLGITTGVVALAFGFFSMGYFNLGVVLATVVIAVAVYGIAFGVRAWRDAVEASVAKEAIAERATVVENELRDERLRSDLTHDFHDVMAHSLAVLAAQAEGLRLSHTQHPERIAPVLQTISDTARLALVEVRQLLERSSDDARHPQPVIADIPALIDQIRSAGPQVSFHSLGRPGSLPKVGEIAAYRIVQESLTNALRHGGNEVAIVVNLTWTGPGLTLGISSRKHPEALPSVPGRGIAGMHERAKLAGGWLDIDDEGEDFVVTGYLPYTTTPQGPSTDPMSEDTLPTIPFAVPQAQPERPAAQPGETAQEGTVKPESTWTQVGQRVDLDGKRFNDKFNAHGKAS
ncbi:histidine kinase [Humidisolicoccus flavus]|uniref:histidine kinase n=1 Tax=Humidisolicoccus flavus TaxID=3111414 RepID=UPI003255918D